MPRYDFSEFSPPPKPWIVAQGDVDDVVFLQEVLDFQQQHPQQFDLEIFPGCGHFFHGRLVELKARLRELILDQGLGL